MRLKLLIPLLTGIATFTSALPVYADSWVNSDVLAANHRAYCSDVIGDHIESEKGSRSINNNGSRNRIRTRNQSESNQSSEQSRRGGGVSIMGVGINGATSRQNSEANRSTHTSNDTFQNSWNSDRQYTWESFEKESIIVGQNCDAFVQTAGQIEIAEINAETQREALRTREKISRLELETNARSNSIEKILKLAGF